MNKLIVLNKKIEKELNNYNDYGELVLVIAEDLEEIVKDLKIITNGCKDLIVEVDDEFKKGTFIIEVLDGKKKA